MILNWISNHIGGPAILIIFGAIISALGAIWSMNTQAKSQNEIMKLQGDLIDKSGEIADLNKNIANSVTGGDSFPYITFSNFNENNKGLIIVHNQGEYPLYDVSGRIVDLEKWGKFGNSADSLNNVQVNFDVGNMPPETVLTRGTVQLPSGDSAKFNIFISARNGSTTQLYRMKRVEGKWKSALRVTTLDGKKILLEEIDPDYPMNENGEVDW